MYYKGPDGRCEINNKEIIEIIQANPEQDFKFIDVNNNKKDITYERVMSLLKTSEENYTGGLIDLNKVIRGGGFIEYIKAIENV